MTSAICSTGDFRIVTLDTMWGMDYVGYRDTVRGPEIDKSFDNLEEANAYMMQVQSDMDRVTK